LLVAGSWCFYAEPPRTGNRATSNIIDAGCVDSLTEIKFAARRTL
jgi:hypothetical protein